MKEIKVDKRFTGSKKRARQMAKEAREMNAWIRWYNLNKKRW